MATQYIQIMNNIIQYDTLTYGIGVPEIENGVALLKVYKLSDGTNACKIYNGSVIAWLLPIAQMTTAAFGNGIKVTIT